MKKYKVVSEFQTMNRWYRVEDQPHTFEEWPDDHRELMIAEKVLYGSIEPVKDGASPPAAEKKRPDTDD